MWHRCFLLICLITIFLQIEPANASCPLTTYRYCPSKDDPVESHYIDPWHLLIASPVRLVKQSTWVYHWCLKADPPATYEFPIDWNDDLIGWSQSTVCGGYAGVTTLSSSPPGQFVPTTIKVGSGRTPLTVHIRKPLVPITDLHEDKGEYRTEMFVSIPIPENPSLTQDMSIILTAAFSRSAKDYTILDYSFTFVDEMAKGDSSAVSFIFDPKAVKDLKDLQGIFKASAETKRINFSSRQPPVNVFSSITFVDSDGKPLGRAPVSLVLPKE
jgi:hypothetical protein